LNLINKLEKYKIILGSQSPRRHHLLKELGIKFEIMVNNSQDESYPAHITKENIPIYLAKKKSECLYENLKENTILITADTIVWLNNQVVGKPTDKEDAKNILQKLSGNKHEVHTGVCIKSLEKETTFCSKTDVYFRELTDNEIIYYLDHCKPFDKAGAYGIQEWIGYIGIERIDGSYFNVMGLPVQKLYTELLRF